MIDITEIDINCFASYGRTGCKVFGFKTNCGPRCSFYKPEDCEDWVRKEVGDRVYLYEPEEWEDLKK